MQFESDRIRLRHMLDAAEEAVSYVQNLERADIKENRQLQHALIRCIEIMGEAAARITEEFRERNPDLPWQDIIGMRNRLIHAYFDVDMEVVWQTAKYELPALINTLKVMLD